MGTLTAPPSRLLPNSSQAIPRPLHRPNLRCHRRLQLQHIGPRPRTAQGPAAAEQDGTAVFPLSAAPLSFRPICKQKRLASRGGSRTSLHSAQHSTEQPCHTQQATPLSTQSRLPLFSSFPGTHGATAAAPRPAAPRPCWRTARPPCRPPSWPRGPTCWAGCARSSCWVPPPARSDEGPRWAAGGGTGAGVHSTAQRGGVATGRRGSRLYASWHVSCRV